MTVMVRVQNYLVLKVSAVKESTTCHFSWITDVYVANEYLGHIMLVG